MKVTSPSQRTEMVYRVSHFNGITDTWTKDGNDMARPYRISASYLLHGATWDSGSFDYDGAGNIKALRGIVEPIARQAVTRQQYGYDAFGNLKAITTDSATQTIQTDSTANRLLTQQGVNAVSYDTAGNLTAWGGYLFSYDGLNAMTALTGGTLNKSYAYDANGERVSFKDVPSNIVTFTLRGLDGKVLREYTSTGGIWSWGKDYVYRQGQLLAEVDGSGARHFSLDHLGSPRLITGSSGNVLEYHAFWAYGGEAGTSGSCDERMKFTGHERDYPCSAGILDYMHARYYSPTTGRFLSVDQGNGKPEVPQSWNRYAYAQGNPVKYVDPDGEAVLPAAALGAAIGGALGFAGSVLAQAYQADWSFANINWRDAGAAAAGGAVSGALFGGTMGLSALASAGVGTAALVGAGSNAVGNAVSRELDSNPATSATSPEEVAWDLGTGAAGGAFGARIQQSIRAALPQIEAQIASSTRGARFGDFGAAQAVRGHVAKDLSVNFRADLFGTIVGAKTTNLVTPLVRVYLQKPEESKFRLFQSARPF